MIFVHQSFFMSQKKSQLPFLLQVLGPGRVDNHVPVDTLFAAEILEHPRCIPEIRGWARKTRGKELHFFYAWHGMCSGPTSKSVVA